MQSNLFFALKILSLLLEVHSALTLCPMSLQCFIKGAVHYMFFCYLICANVFETHFMTPL